MKYIFAIGLSLLLFSCSNSFVNHSITYQKIGQCSEYTSPVKMVSNINGERYEFNVCMDDAFNGKTYTVKRSGDSILVDFPKASVNQSLFRVTLDIDAKPAYHIIDLDGREVRVSSSEK